MKIIDTRRTVEGLLGVVLVLALAKLIGPLPAVFVVLAVYLVYKTFNKPSQKPLPLTRQAKRKKK